MPTLTDRIWTSAGSPDVAGVVGTNDPCMVCGGDCERGGVPAKKAFGSNFSAHDQLAAPWSSHVCRACVWAMSGRPPDTLRMWTIVYREDAHWLHPRPEKSPSLGARVYATNRADMREVLRLLVDPPACEWGLAVTVSMQIHIVPFTPLCSGARGCSGQFERERMSWTPSDAVALCEAVRALVDAGFPKAEIETGETTAQTLRRAGVALWRQHAPLLRRWANAALLRVVVMATRKGML